MTFEMLKERRKLFNEFAINVLPDEVLNSDRLSFVDLVKKIETQQDQKIFCKRAIEMLEANIEHYRPNATALPKPSRNNTFVVASTLIASGVVHYKFGTSVALVVAGTWYWFAAHSSDRGLKEQLTEVNQHNLEVDGWQKSLNGWKMDRDELRSLFPNIA